MGNASRSELLPVSAASRSISHSEHCSGPLARCPIMMPAGRGAMLISCARYSAPSRKERGTRERRYVPERIWDIDPELAAAAESERRRYKGRVSLEDFYA